MINNLSLLVSEKANIIEACISYMKVNYATRTNDYDKCRRDLTYIMEAFIHDLSNNTISNTIYIANRFWIRNKRQIGDYEVEVALYNYMIRYITEVHSVTQEFAETINNLKCIIIDIIKNGAIEEPNTWQKSASMRINTYNWKPIVPKKDIIDSIIEDLHNYSPSKQNGFRYKIDIYRNDNEKKRNKIYRAHAAELTPDARHNPQVLAPWLFFLSLRKESVTELDDYKKNDYFMDLGIATSNIIYGASSRGLDTGISRCINYKQPIIDVLGYVPDITIGLGYRNDDRRYFCPHYKKLVGIPGDKNIKPNIDSYVNYV